MRMRAGVQRPLATRAANPQPSNRPATLANLVACGTNLESTATEWRMLGGTTSFTHAQGLTISLVATREQLKGKYRFGANAGRTTWSLRRVEPPVPGNRHGHIVLPTLVAQFLMSRCECRWNYSLLSSW